MKICSALFAGRSVSTLLFVTALTLLARIHTASASLSRITPFQKTCYTAINEDVFACIQYFDKDGVSGCAQCSDVLTSPMVYFEELSSFRSFLLGTLSSERSKFAYVVMIPLIWYTDPDVMYFIKENPKRVTALLIDLNPTELNSTTPIDPYPPVDSFSPTSQFPNRMFTLTPNLNYSWNPRGVDYLSTENNFFLPFNVFFVNSTLGETLRILSLRFLNQNFATEPNYPRQVVESNGQMWSCGKTGYTCLINSTCLPIGQESVYSSVGKVDTRLEIISVSAQFDSDAFARQNLAYGANAEMVSLGTMMAVADSFFQYRMSTGVGKPIVRLPLFLAFQADTWGFSGSKRFLEDVKSFVCLKPLNVSQAIIGCRDPYMPSAQFQLFKDMDWIGDIDISQLGNVDVSENGTYFVHSLNTSDNSFLLENLNRALGDLIKPSSVNNQVGIPPVSSQSFYEVFNQSFPSVFIGDFDAQFRNPFYHSLFDNITEVTNASIDKACLLAQGISKTLVQMAYADMSTIPPVNCSLIYSMVECMTGNFTGCGLSQQFLDSSNYALLTSGLGAPDANFASMYQPLPITLNVYPSRMAKASLIYAMLGYYNAYNQTRVPCKSISDCSEVAKQANNNYTDITPEEAFNIGCYNGECVVTNTWFHPAYGTGLVPRNSDFSLFAVDNNSASDEATFSTSLYDTDLGICTQTVDSYDYQVAILVVGVMMWVICAIPPGIHFYFDRKAKAKTAKEAEQLPT